MTIASEKKILVVEDEPDVKNYLCSCLQDCGFKVRTAINGVDAMEVVQNDTPDLITLDMVLPRKSGVRFMRELRQYPEWSTIPVIVITAHARDEMGSEEIKELNAFATRTRPKYILEKPIKPSGLVNAIADILEVELETGEEPQPSENFENLISTLIQNADEDTLKQIRDMLNKKE